MRKRKYIDFENMEVLFEHNGKKFCGNRDVVYESINVLNGLVELCHENNNNKHIVLSGKLPNIIINRYIESCYNLPFDMNTIEKEYFMEFLLFLDKYPTTVLSINTLEDQIVKYLINHKILCNNNTYLDNMCARYKLKKLYLYIHIQKLNVKN